MRSFHLVLGSALCAVLLPNYALAEETVSLPLSADGGVAPEDQDSDCDGLTDLEEAKRTYAGHSKTDALLWDSDLDGIPDGAEVGRRRSRDARCAGVVLAKEGARRSSPVDSDTDGDGIPDGVEDKNRNGVLDPGETDPLKVDTDGDGIPDGTELSHGTPAHTHDFPEPMVYDLVRGLNASQGELEINALVLVQPRRDGKLQIKYAPEIEYAFADGFTVEFELPFEQERLVAFKYAVQGLLYRTSDGRFQHGWQVLGEIDVPDSTPEAGGEIAKLGRQSPSDTARGAAAAVAELAEGRLVATHIGNLAIGQRVSLVSIVGLEAYRHGGRTGGGGVANLSVFYNVSEQVALGTEQNLLVYPDLGRSHGSPAVDVRWRVMPQAHLTLVPGLASLQLGLGVAGHQLTPRIEGGGRAIVAF